MLANLAAANAQQTNSIPSNSGGVGLLVNQNQTNNQQVGGNNDVAIHSLIEELLVSVSEIKVGLEQLLLKVDSGVHTNSLLDSLSVTSGQMHMLCRKLSLNTLVPIASSPAGQQNQQQSKYSLLSSVVFTPQNLSMAQDDHLAQLTEGRARCFDHQLVPLYLRTKLIPTLENKLQILAEEASSKDSELQASVGSNRELLRKIVDEVTSLMASVEGDLNRSASENAIQSCTVNDTAALLAAVTEGRGIKNQVAAVHSNTMKQFPNVSLTHLQQQPNMNMMSQHNPQMNTDGAQMASGMGNRGNMSQGQTQPTPTIVKPIIRS